MPLGSYTSAAFTTATGVAVAANADVEVRRESDGALASIFSDRAGSSAITQPGFQADAEGRFVFYAAGLSGGYQVKSTKGAETYTARYQATGTVRELDADPFWATVLAAATAAAARLALGFAAIAAKGDSWWGSAADTIAKLTVGANGTILRADSAQAAGVKWEAPATQAEMDAGTAGKVLTTDLNRIALETVVDISTGAASYDITGIPSGVRRVTVMGTDMSTSGTSMPMIQLGDSEGIEPTGYVGTGKLGSSVTAFTTGFGLAGTWGGTVVTTWKLVLDLMDPSSNKWLASLSGARTDSADDLGGGGRKSLSGELDRIRLTTVGGSETFDGVGSELQVSFER